MPYLLHIFVFCPLMYGIISQMSISVSYFTKRTHCECTSLYILNTFFPPLDKSLTKQRRIFCELFLRVRQFCQIQNFFEAWFPICNIFSFVSFFVSYFILSFFLPPVFLFLIWFTALSSLPQSSLMSVVIMPPAIFLVCWLPPLSPPLLHCGRLVVVSVLSRSWV